MMIFPMYIEVQAVGGYEEKGPVSGLQWSFSSIRICLFTYLPGELSKLFLTRAVGPDSFGEGPTSNILRGSPVSSC